MTGNYKDFKGRINYFLDACCREAPDSANIWKKVSAPTIFEEDSSRNTYLSALLDLILLTWSGT